MFSKEHEKVKSIDQKRKMNERMFTLNVNMSKMNSMMFTHGKGVEDIGIWHMHIGHVNIHCFKSMENQNLVGGLPKFEAKEVMLKVCETYQIRK
jgi:hypothetical protein